MLKLLVMLCVRVEGEVDISCYFIAVLLLSHGRALTQCASHVGHDII